KGEFLSEDPVFLGDPKQQVLTDPQSLNSYSYANDNPITKSDPNGRDATTYSVGMGAELGFGFFGGGQASVGFSIVYDPKTGQRWLAFPVISYGGCWLAQVRCFDRWKGPVLSIHFGCVRWRRFFLQLFAECHKPRATAQWRSGRHDQCERSDCLSVRVGRRY